MLIAGLAHADNDYLQYRIHGLDPEQLANTQAHLGPPPRSEEERDNFLFAARGLIQESLNALGYYQGEISFDLDDSGPVWQLLIEVDPGLRVRLGSVDIRIDGAAAADDAFARLLAEQSLRVGDSLHHEKYEEFKARLQNLGRDRGYFDAELTRHRVIVDLAEESAAVELYYNSGERYRFGEVLWDEYPLLPRLLHSLQNFQPGQAFSIQVLREFQASLQRTGYFESALVRPLPPDPVTRSIAIKVDLLAGDRNHYRVGLGYSTDTRERVSFTWRTPRINRRGHFQETRLEYSPVTPRIRFDYTIPLAHPLHDKLLLGARAEKNEYGSLDSEQEIVYMRREWVRNDWISSAGARYLNEDWDVGSTALNNNYILFGATLSNTRRRGNALDPQAGFSQLHGVEFGLAQAGSDLDLLRFYSNLRGVFSLGEKHRLVGRAELGAVFFQDNMRPDLAPSLSFFAGGAHSIRGYAYQSLGPTEQVAIPGGEELSLVVGGDRLLVFSSEYQYYFTPEWRAGVFVDAGNAFNSRDFEPVVGAGFGVHYVSPVGAVRIDFGNPVSEDSSSWRVHLNVGAEF